MTEKKPTNKEIIDLMFGEFKGWVTKSYGFIPNYQELRQLAINIFWSEYVVMVQQALEKQAAEALENAEEKVEEVLIESKDTTDSNSGL